MNIKKQKRQKLRVTITCQADYNLDDLDNLIAWKDSIIADGSILEEKVEVIEEET